MKSSAPSSKQLLQFLKKKGNHEFKIIDPGGKSVSLTELYVKRR